MVFESACRCFQLGEGACIEALLMIVKSSRSFVESSSVLPPSPSHAEQWSTLEFSRGENDFIIVIPLFWAAPARGQRMPAKCCRQLSPSYCGGRYASKYRADCDCSVPAAGTRRGPGPGRCCSRDIRTHHPPKLKQTSGKNMNEKNWIYRANYLSCPNYPNRPSIIVS